MIDWRTGGGVYIAVGATDMRKSVNGLSLLVEEHFELDLFSGNLSESRSSLTCLL